MSQYFITFVELEKPWYHSHAKYCVAILFNDLRQALALWWRCNGVTEKTFAVFLAAGSKGFYVFTMLEKPTFEEVLQEYFFIHGPNAADINKRVIFNLLIDHLYYTPDMVELDHETLDSLQGMYVLMDKLEEVENNRNAT